MPRARSRPGSHTGFPLNRWPAEGVQIAWGSRRVAPGNIVVKREEEDLVVWMRGEVTYPLRLTISPA